MSGSDDHSLEQGVAWLRGAGEETRLRILALLGRAELTVSDLVEVLDQSQPRISRHLKLLLEAGLLERFQEGAWAYFRHHHDARVARFLAAVVGTLQADDATIAEDRRRLDAILYRRSERAAAYFAANADEWNRIRAMHIPEEEVEAAMLALGLAHAPQSLLDMGTGTGRILQLFAPHIARGVGIDTSGDMLTLARNGLVKADITHMQARRGDVYQSGLEERFDLVTLHLVLHYLEDPAAAIGEAARHLSREGRLLVVDFAPHHHEILRETHAHRRLGISDEQMERWLGEAGLELERRQVLLPQGAGQELLTVVIYLARRGLG